MNQGPSGPIATLTTNRPRESVYNININFEYLKQTLKEELLLYETTFHPIQGSLSAMNADELIDIAACLSIPIPANTDLLRGEIALKIFHRNSASPLKELNDICNTIRAVDERGAYKAAYTGRKLLNPAGVNICYLNSLTNGLLSFKNVRRDVLLARRDPKCSQIVNVFNDFNNNTYQLRDLMETHNTFKPGQMNDPNEAFRKLLETMPYNKGIYEKTSVFSMCTSCNGSLRDDDLFTTECGIFPRADNVQEMIKKVDSNVFDKCRNCEETNVPFTETHGLRNPGDTIIIGTTRNTHLGGELSPVFPSHEIEVDSEFYKISAVLSYQGLHYYTTLRLGNAWYEVNDYADIKEVEAPMNGYMFFYKKTTEDVLDTPLPTFTRVHSRTSDTPNVFKLPTVLEERPKEDRILEGAQNISKDYEENPIH